MKKILYFDLLTKENSWKAIETSIASQNFREYEENGYKKFYSRVQEYFKDGETFKMCKFLHLKKKGNLYFLKSDSYQASRYQLIGEDLDKFLNAQPETKICYKSYREVPDKIPCYSIDIFEKFYLGFVKPKKLKIFGIDVTNEEWEYWAWTLYCVDLNPQCTLEEYNERINLNHENAEKGDWWHASTYQKVFIKDNEMYFEMLACVDNQTKTLEGYYKQKEVGKRIAYSTSWPFVVSDAPKSFKPTKKDIKVLSKCQLKDYYAKLDKDPTILKIK